MLTTHIKFELKPLKGSGPLLFGMSRTAAQAALLDLGIEKSSSRKNSDFFCENAIQLECDRNGQVHFIGFSCHERIVPLYAGIDVFAVSAKELFQLMSKGEGNGLHEFNRSQYCFPTQMLTLWDADHQYDCRTNESRQVWGQVGLGSPGYLSAIRAITRGA